MERILGLALNSLRDASQINELGRHMPGRRPASGGHGLWVQPAWHPSFLFCCMNRAKHVPVTAPRRGRAQDSPYSRTGTTVGGDTKQLAQEKDGDP